MQKETSRTSFSRDNHKHAKASAEHVLKGLPVKHRDGDLLFPVKQI